MIDLQGADFLDFGASHGGTLRWGEQTFGGTGVGLDKNPAKVAAAHEAGFRAVEADVAELDLPEDAVSFAVVSDFLEHLTFPALAEKVIDSAIRVSRDFVFFAFPDFDGETRLNKLGFKRYYADWSGHTLHLGGGRFARMVLKHGLPAHCFKTEEIFNSFDRHILPLDAKRNSSFYDPAVHGPRDYVSFPRKIFFARNIGVVAKSERYPLDPLVLKILYSLSYLRPIAPP